MDAPASVSGDRDLLFQAFANLLDNAIKYTPTQGRISIEADEGRAKRMELEDSTWQFAGNVVIDIGAGRIECDSADLYFDDFRLRTAIVTGSPAIYNLKRQGSEGITHGEAGRLEYDVDAGVIEFS